MRGWADSIRACRLAGSPYALWSTSLLLFRPPYSAFRPPRLDPPGDDRPLPRRGSQSEGGFTLIEVMMAATILVVGFIGMIQAVSLTCRMMDHARRQILATQIVNHEIEKLRLVGWSNGSTGINDLAAGPTTVTIDSQ